MIDVLPGQLKVANTEMELVEEENIVHSVPEVNTNSCTCAGCARSIHPSLTYVFYGKHYCVENCLEKLLVDLEETGVITIDRSEADAKGNIIRS